MNTRNRIAAIFIIVMILLINAAPASALGTLQTANAARNLQTTSVCVPNVTESSQYSLVYEVAIPLDSDYNAGLPSYLVDNTASTGSFDRIAYCLELDGNWVWVSMNAFTAVPSQIGVPVVSTGATFQQTVTNMNVSSNVPGIVTGTGITTGNIEFWHSCYDTWSTLFLPGANDGLYDFDDTAFGSSCWGSMQVHNYGALQTIFGWNNWDDAGNDDLGIGNNPVGNPDWTYQGNAAAYGVRNLKIYIRESTPPTVTVNQASGQADPTNTSPINFTATFSETINTTTFTASDVTLGGTAPGTLAAIITEVAPNNGTTFNIAVSGMTGNGIVTASLGANTVQDLAGNNNATASTGIDNQVTLNLTPSITSAAPLGGSTGVVYNHAYTASGSVPITFSLSAGTLPPGLTLTSAGVLSGTPTTLGTYIGTVTASNGILPNDLQNFSITINQLPTIISANNASFTLGVAGTFTVTATGSPTPTLSMTGTLPAGVTFTPATGILAGTPVAGTGGSYPLTFTAANGFLPDAVQNFTLIVTDGPSFTSANNTSFNLGFSGTFTVSAVGSPAPSLSMTGSLPAGVTFTPATGILAGTPALGTAGSYALTFTATNGMLPDAIQSFTLTVKGAPIVSANGINSSPTTADGHISNNEIIKDTLGITKLMVQFDQDVYDPAGNTDPKDVTNPANYMLVLGSSTGVFQTVSCLGGVIAPDVALSVDSVSYNNSAFLATLNINSGNPLNVVGFYRLYVCGTTSIIDAANVTELAGDGVNAGTDFLLNFRIRERVVANTTATTAVATTAALIPVTGFAPDRITHVPAQPADKAYKSMGEIRIEIPTLGINYPIVGAMLDKNIWDLTWLKDSVAYLEGSAYPTLAGNTVLTAHVIDANNNLGPFSDIKGMQSGQKIYIHANGQIYIYQVQENRKIAPSNISAAFEHEENSWITLVTCEDYNEKTGSYKYRRMVRAVLVSVISEK